MEKVDLEKLLANAMRSDAATLHLVAGHRPSMRVKGRLVSLEGESCSAKGLDDLSREFLFEDHRQRLEAGEEVQFLYTSQSGVRFRTVVMRQSEGCGLAFHRIPTEIASFADLNLPPLLAGFSTLPSGLILVTGFMGSGKSTTVAATVDHINQNRAAHVVMIESGIEYIHDSVNSCVHQREVGFHANSYASGVREACRSGADVIVVGNVRDSETMDAILDATEQGVLVITTIHASSVSAAVSELQGYYPADDRPRMRARLALAFKVITSQTLINRANQRGKVPLLEILINCSEIARTIRTGSLGDLPEIMKKNRGLGTQTTDMGLRDLLNKSLISEEDALFHADDRDAVVARQHSVRG